MLPFGYKNKIKLNKPYYSSRSGLHQCCSRKLRHSQYYILPQNLHALATPYLATPSLARIQFWSDIIDLQYLIEYLIPYRGLNNSYMGKSEREDILSN
jgi:hypothetical protein